MKIVVTGGNECAEFVVGMLSGNKHKVMVIDRDKAFCERVCGAYDVEATLGDPCQEEILKEAGIRNYDVIAALGQEDTDNFEICQMCRKVFGIQKTVCFVRNPRNVEVFEQLGMDQVINVPRLVAAMIG